MGAGKDIYEQNKLLRAENDLLREREENLRLKREEVAGELADLAMKAAMEFLAGRAAIVSSAGHEPESRVYYFQMPPVAPAST